MPAGIQANILKIEDGNDCNVQYALPGENVQIKIHVADESAIQKGSVLCCKNNAIPVSVIFEAEVEIIDLPESKPIISKGYTCMMHIHSNQEEVEITDLVKCWSNDPNGDVNEKIKPKFIKSQTRLICRIKTNNAIGLEKFETNERLGRFTLRDDGQTIGIGKILKYKPYQQKVAEITTNNANDITSKKK